jgi:uncharacterized membrane protein
MEILLLFIILVIVALLLSSLSEIKKELRALRGELTEVRNSIQTVAKQNLGSTDVKIPAAPTTVPEEKTYSTSKEFEVPDLSFLKRKTPVAIVIPPDAPPPHIYPDDLITDVHKPPQSKTHWFRKWLLENPDIEKFIGENLINKIGIAVLVLGIAFFVKYAIDQEWINKIGRVGIGIFCGIILIWLANRLRRNYHAFSSVLVGGGLTVFYFTIAFAFHQYQLISQPVAFGIMVVITIFAVTLSILYDRIELGILATVGGFITPFLVSHGDGNWLALFSYLSILNAGLIVLAYYKRWRIINFIAFFFTQIIYITWIISKIGSPDFNYQGIFIFGLIFYGMFLVMNVIHHVVRASKLLAFDFIILLSANLCFFGVGIDLIQSSGVSQYSGLFAASLGIVNLMLAYLFFRKSDADKKFIYLLIGITISFLTIAAPVQLKGHYITLFWAAETVVLLWLYQKSFINLLKISVLVVTVLMFFSLLMDWNAIYDDDKMIHTILFNKGWITGIFSSASLFFVYRLLTREADTFYIWGITNKLLRNIYLAGSVLLLFSTGALEINDQFQKRMPATGLEVIYIQLYLTVFVLLLLFIIQKLKFAIHPFLRVTISFAAIIIYLFNFLGYQTIEEAVLNQGKFRGYFLADWINALLLLALIWNLIRFIRNNKPVFGKYWLNLTWIISVICVIIFSSEIANGFVWLNYTNKPSFQLANELFDKAGLTIVWAVSSFAMIWLGMKYSYKPLRITALILFGITLIKLFMFDIKDIAPGGKIIAFILLGVLLLVISFMYQRLKKIIIDDSEKHL